MKVKVGDRIYDSDEQPISVYRKDASKPLVTDKVKIGDDIYDSSEYHLSLYLDDAEKPFVAEMEPDKHYFTAYPSGTPEAEMDAFVDDFKARVEAEATSAEQPTPGPQAFPPPKL